MKSLLVCTYILMMSVAAQVAQERFISGEGNFAIGISAPLTEQKDARFVIGQMEYVGKSIVWQDQAGTFVSVENYLVYGESPRLTPEQKVIALQGYKKSLIDQLQKAKVATAEFPYQFLGSKGVEIKGVAAGRALIRIFWGKERLYSISVTRRDVQDFASQAAVLDSFRLLTMDEYRTARISENSPAELPQSPPAKLVSNDLKDRGYHDRIRYVLEEYQDTPRSVRNRWSEAAFGEAGFLTKEISYFNNYPDEIEFFGWIDGKRVSNSRTIEYSSVEGPNEKTITMLTQVLLSAPNSSPENAPVRDLRFETRYERAYDLTNRLVLEEVFGNDGSLRQRKKYSYRDRQRDSTSSWGSDSPSKSFEILDERGFTVEERDCDANGKKCDVSIYKYKFDAKGNWIEKQVFDKKSVKGKVILKPSGVFFRTIQYYPSGLPSTYE